MTSANLSVGGPDANDAIIVNVLDNISHYSTPPGSADRSAVSLVDYLKAKTMSSLYFSDYRLST